MFCNISRCFESHGIRCDVCKQLIPWWALRQSCAHIWSFASNRRLSEFDNELLPSGQFCKRASFGTLLGLSAAPPRSPSRSDKPPASLFRSSCRSCSRRLPRRASTCCKVYPYTNGYSQKICTSPAPRILRHIARVSSHSAPASPQAANTALCTSSKRCRQKT